MPVLDILYNDVLRFLWNTLLLVILNLMIYVWNSLVQLIGFFMHVHFLPPPFRLTPLQLLCIERDHHDSLPRRADPRSHPPG